ncbi:methyltransferase family protein [Actinocatenispora rupis]|uniref:Protein-S-isoprenylcysteine O-methyltransferase Ste14 n=1 Tax=Actinocatenispora rupis TaxID=519421 RepID=A0A8J3J7I7_9ACTN|nr:isoprenylcysteine carboxylmethyltransferase family protein [Actinocatenispora rupis]GID11529.1 hypothetical protein Aru02nite_24180 [Actinocatenispora rupis]
MSESQQQGGSAGTDEAGPGGDVRARLRHLDRATLPMYVASFTRPFLVLLVIPAVLTVVRGLVSRFALGGSMSDAVRAGIGTGALRGVTIVVGVFFAVNFLVWFPWAIGTFARFGQTLEPAHEPRVMVVGGPYRLCRSPMIFGVYCGLAAETLLLNWWLGVFFVLFVVWMSASHLRQNEEPTMGRIFGDAWRTYRAETPALLPRLTRYRRFDPERDLVFPTAD